MSTKKSIILPLDYQTTGELLLHKVKKTQRVEAGEGDNLEPLSRDDVATLRH